MEWAWRHPSMAFLVQSPLVANRKGLCIFLLIPFWIFQGKDNWFVGWRSKFFILFYNRNFFSSKVGFAGSSRGSREVESGLSLVGSSIWTSFCWLSSPSGTSLSSVIFFMVWLLSSFRPLRSVTACAYSLECWMAFPWFGPVYLDGVLETAWLSMYIILDVRSSYLLLSSL